MWNRVKRLGEGAYGSVSLAISWGSSNCGFDLPPLFAVKSAEFSKSSSLQHERLLLDEFRECSNIIQCYGADSSEEDGVILYNLILEYADGGCMVDRIYFSKQVLLENEVKEYTKSILMGLSFIHSKGFAHCDIKPGNILLVKDDDDGDDGGGERATAKICDFGLAKLVDKTPKPNVRRKGFRGTPMYLAPEAILYGEYGCEVDIWALGCTVLEMIMKEPLWDFDPNTESVDQLLERIVNQEVQIPTGMLSRDAEDFLNKCLIKNPKLRWTADMLLRHPFVASKSCSEPEASNLSSLRSNIEEAEAEAEMLVRYPTLSWIKKEKISIPKCSEASTLSSLRCITEADIDLLMNAAAGRLKRAAEDSVSDKFLCNKRACLLIGAH